MENKIDVLKTLVAQACNHPDFSHQEWYLKYHLEIIEKFCKQLLLLHPEANKDRVDILIWTHDYEKITTHNEKEDAFDKGMLRVRTLMESIGFDHGVIERTIDDITVFDRKNSEVLTEASIEIQIISSADAAAHFVGPFFPIYWKEFGYKSIEQLMADNAKKLDIDWNHKMVLPEVKRVFKERYKFLREMLIDPMSAINLDILPNSD